MKASGVIKELAALIARYGDLDVTAQVTGCCAHGHGIDRLDVLDTNEKDISVDHAGEPTEIVLRCS